MLAAACVAAFAGCGSDRLPTVPARGRVLFKGAPAPYVAMVFKPVTPPPGGEQLAFSASTDEEGKFEIQTYDAGDGAPAGTYQVGLTWFVSDLKETDPENRIGKKDRLQGKYADPASSGLVVEVKPGQVDLADIVLK